MRFTHSSDFGEHKTVTLSMYSQPKSLLQKKQNPTENELFGQDYSMSLINKSYQNTKVVAPPPPPPVKGAKPGPPPRPQVTVKDNLKNENNEYLKFQIKEI